jgi:hypothetical protein
VKSKHLIFTGDKKMKMALSVGILLFSLSAFALPPVEFQPDDVYAFLLTDNPENIFVIMNNLWKGATDRNEYKSCNVQPDENKRPTNDPKKWVIGWSFKETPSRNQAKCKAFFLELVKKKYQGMVYAENYREIPGVKLPTGLKSYWEGHIVPDPLVKPLDPAAMAAAAATAAH